MATLAQIEATLQSRIGAMFGGTIPAATLDAAIARAIMFLGGTVQDITAPTDDDVATVPTPALLDYAELFLMETRLNQYTSVDVKAGPVEAKNSQYASQLRNMIATKRAELENLYGSPSGGYGFAVAVPVLRSNGCGCGSEYTCGCNLYPR